MFCPQCLPRWAGQRGFGLSPKFCNQLRERRHHMKMHYDQRMKRSGWAPGPWDSEQDIYEWIDPTTGLYCRILRVPHRGHLCGYVRVPRGVRNSSRRLQCHGGTTFDKKMKKSRYFKAGRWVGFDCAHLGDLSPGMEAEIRGLPAELGDAAMRLLQSPYDGVSFGPSQYRNVAYCLDQVTELASQVVGWGR